MKRLWEKFDFFLARLFGKMLLGLSTGPTHCGIHFIWKWRGHDYTMTFPVPNDQFTHKDNGATDAANYQRGPHGYQ